MNRPHAGRDRVVADAVRATATQHAHRAAYLARRRAAARRRALLTLVLLVASAVTWVLVGAVSAPVLAGVVPTVALGGVLVLGRRAVVAAARADAAWAAGAADRVPLPGARVTGRAVRPSDAVTEVMARVRPEARATTSGDVERRTVKARPTQDRTATGAGTTAPSARAGAPAATGAPAGTSTRAAGAADPRPAAEADTAHVPDALVAEAEEPSWVPVPVPRPTYTLKPSAPRREPAPLPTEGLANTRVDESDGTADAETATTPTTDAATSSDAGAPSTAPLDLDAILARRRAAGE